MMLNKVTPQMSRPNDACTTLTMQTLDRTISSGKMLPIFRYSECCRRILQEIRLAIDVVLAFADDLVDVLRHPLRTNNAFPLK